MDQRTKTLQVLRAFTNEMGLRTALTAILGYNVIL